MKEFREFIAGYRAAGLTREVDELEKTRVKFGKRPGFPESLAAVGRIRSETAPKVDLRQRTYELLSLVREPSDAEQEALKGRGIKFLPVTSTSYAEVVAEDQAYFWDGELAYANDRPRTCFKTDSCGGITVL